jgi:hypothetical protein
LHIEALKKYKPGIKPIDMYRSKATLDLIKYSIWKFITVRGI